MDARAAAPGPTLGRTVLATSFGFSLIQLDVTIVNVALPHIGHDLGTSVAGLQWVVDAYAMVFATLLLTGGYCGDRFGAKRLYLAGLAVFAVASALCGFAGSAGQLVAGRLLQGIGAATMLPCSLALLNHAAAGDAKRRAWAIGWWTAASSIAVASGPVIGGLILSVASWRAIFLVNLPICVIGAVLASRTAETEVDRRARGFDLPGQLLGIVALGALVGTVIEMRPRGLGDPLVLGGLATTLAATIAFVAAEARAATPMLPLTLFRTQHFAVCVVVGATANFTYYGLIFVLSLYLQQGLGYGAAATGLAFLPLTATFVVGNLFCGALIGRFGYRLPMAGGLLVDACGFALLLTLGRQSPYAAMVLPFMLMPLGMGTAIPAMTTAVLAGVPRAQSGIAAAVLNAARQAGGAVGVALFGALSAADVVRGLHWSATIAAAALLLVAALVRWRLPRRSVEA